MSNFFFPCFFFVFKFSCFSSLFGFFFCFIFVSERKLLWTGKSNRPRFNSIEMYQNPYSHTYTQTHSQKEEREEEEDEVVEEGVVVINLIDMKQPGNTGLRVFFSWLRVFWAAERHEQHQQQWERDSFSQFLMLDWRLESTPIDTIFPSSSLESSLGKDSERERERERGGEGERERCFV